MDLLSQYKKEHPEAFQEKPALPMTDEYGREYATMVRWVIQLSGGRIRDARQASYALLGATILIFLAALTMFFMSFNVLPASRLSEEEAKKQMEEYKKIQPF